MKLFLEILSGMANSEDLYQNAPSRAVKSGSALFAYAILSTTLVYKTLEHFPLLWTEMRKTIILSQSTGTDGPMETV